MYEKKQSTNLFYKIMNIDGGYRKFYLIFTPLANVVLLDFATYRAIFETTIGEASSYSLERLILHPSRNSGRSDLSVLTRARYPVGSI